MCCVKFALIIQKSSKSCENIRDYAYNTAYPNNSSNYHRFDLRIFFHSILRELKYGEFSLNFTITLFYCLPLTSIKSIFRVNTVSHRYRTICNQLILKLCSFSSTVENNFARTIDIINTPENVQCNISMKIDVMYFHSINGHFHCSTNVVFVVEKFPIFFLGKFSLKLFTINVTKRRIVCFPSSQSLSLCFALFAAY